MRRIILPINALIEVITLFGLAILVFRVVSGSPLGTRNSESRTGGLKNVRHLR